MSIVLKNFILFFLVVIIFHFLIINELVKTKSRIDTRVLNTYTGSQNKDTSEFIKYDKKSGNNRFKSNPVSHNKFIVDNTLVAVQKNEVVNEEVQKEYVPNREGENEIPSVMRDVEKYVPNNCKEMTRTSNSNVSNPKMKELYDFVFDESEKNNTLDSVFEVNSVTNNKPSEDNKEISNHHQLVTKSIDIETENQQQLLYDYQVIGQIDTNIGDGLMGIDSMLTGNFSKVI